MRQISVQDLYKRLAKELQDLPLAVTKRGVIIAIIDKPLEVQAGTSRVEPAKPLEDEPKRAKTSRGKPSKPQKPLEVIPTPVKPEVKPLEDAAKTVQEMEQALEVVRAQKAAVPPPATVKTVKTFFKSDQFSQWKKKAK